MRSLTPLTCYSRVVEGKKPEARYTSLAVRPEETALTHGRAETTYLASERQLPDGGVEIQVFVGNSTNPDAHAPVASFQAPPEPPFELPSGKHVVDFRYLAETNTLAIVLAGGDIVIVNLEEDLLPDQEKVEVVGSVESGIKAAGWSPDEELLVLITGEDNLVEMTKTFDVLAEVALKTDEFGEDAPVNVGWGAQDTQFHGSIGKAGRDAVAGLPAATRLNTPGSSAQPETTTKSQSDITSRISWRGDGAFFAVSTQFGRPNSAGGERRIRFYSRTAVLQSTSEPTPNLEGCLAWQPSGSIIASSANNASQIVFFERNGLRRYEFELKEEKPEYGSVVRQLSWNADSTVLAVWIERQQPESIEERHVIQLWRRNNYHWYLKQSIRPALSESSTLEQFVWNLEQALSLYLVTSTGCEKRVYHWDTIASERAAPADSGAVAVVDGSRILLTPFRYQNVPPPMYSLALQDPLDLTPIHAAFSAKDDIVAALMPDGHVNLWRWTFGKGNKSSQMHLKRQLVQPAAHGRVLRRQISVQPTASQQGQNLVVHILASAVIEELDILTSLKIRIEGEAVYTDDVTDVPLSSSILSIIATEDGLYLQDTAGRILDQAEQPLASFPEPCTSMRVVSQRLFLGLSESGRLFANSRLLASGCTSFAIGGEFLIYTTLQHEARFLLLQSLQQPDAQAEDELETYSHPIKSASNPQQDAQEATYNRRVERGSRIVSVVPSSMNLVLQMPRGNLETVSPRPLVLQVVRKHLDQQQYKKAFVICRRHRIDLNFLYDHHPEAFKRDLALFAEQIADNEYLGLFVSSLKNQDVTQTLYKSLTLEQPAQSADGLQHKVNTLCRDLRACLESKDLLSYANTILTTYVCQQPPDLESALQVITQIKPMSLEAAEDAIKYIIFLADANKLFDVALAMYDFELVLAVAQNSQKDPREYIPFLRELRAYEKYYQRYKIDDHLKQYKKALRNLADAGDEHFPAVLSYMQRHELYDDAVSVYAQRSQRKTVLDLRGDWLMKYDRCHEAALSYTLANQPRKAMIAHQRALTWVELFDIALREQLTAEEIGTLAENVAASLKNKHRHAEAGRVLLEYGRNVKGAVTTLSEGGEFAEALRIASLYSAQDMVAEIITPLVLEATDRLSDEAEEVQEQVSKQVERLFELREKRISDSAGFYGRLLPPSGDDALDNVDVQTDAGASTVATTQFTRYTAAPASTRAGTVKSGVSRKTARKQMRRAASGAKGSIFEESYLLGSLARLVTEGGRIAQLVSTTAALARVIVRISAMPSVTETLDSDISLLERAHDLQETVSKLVEYAKKVIDDIWEALGDAKLHDLDAALLADTDPDQADAELLKKPGKPKFASLGHWNVSLLGLLQN